MHENIPNQRIPISRKGKEFKDTTMAAYISLIDDRGQSRREGLQKLYDYYNGVINTSDYDYVLKPYGKKREFFPSKMRNYPLIKPVIDYLLGEKAKRPFNYSVVVTNQDTITRKETELNTSILGTIEQDMVNAMNEAGMETGQESKETQEPKVAAEMHNRSYVDNHAVLGQKGMAYIIREARVHENLQKCWFHFMVSGECFSERTLRNNEVSYYPLNPMDIDYDLDPELDYVEDADWAVITRWMTPSQIIERWGSRMTTDQMDEIFSDSGKGEYFDGFTSLRDSRTSRQSNRLTKVTTVYWQGMERRGIVSYLDPMTGAEEMFEVEDGYKIEPWLKELEAKIQWLWDNKVWEGTNIGDNDSGFSIDVQPYAYERASIDNVSKNKLPINGRRYSDINTANVSPVMLGIPYQLNYNTYKYRLELAIARSKDIIAQFDINLIPKKWSMDKFMNMVEGSGIAWVDYNKEGIRLNPQHQTVMDLSIKTIDMYLNLLASIEEEWHRVAGVNRQRLGEMSPYEGKATGQQAIVQSSHTTEDMYRKFAGFEQRDMQALLDLSKHCWKDGKKTSFVMPDGTREYLNIDPEVWNYSDLGVFMSDSSKDQEKLNYAIQVAQGIVQKGGPASTALEIIDQENFVLMKEKIKKVEDELAQQQQQAQQAEQQAMAEQSKAEQAIREAEFADNDKDRESKEKIAREHNDTLLQIADANAASKYSEPIATTTTAAPEGPTQMENAFKNRETRVKEGQLSETIRHNQATEKITRDKPTPTARK